VEAPIKTASNEVFALTDEQLLGIEPDDVIPPSGEVPDLSESAPPASATTTQHHPSQAEPPRWLAERMRDPWAGEEARELWEGVQNAQREAAAYRESFATPEEARALKEIYPNGAVEAKAAAERARDLAEIDVAIFGAPGKSPEELRAGRSQLVERLHAQDPAAFREMVEVGRQILERTGITQSPMVRAANATPQVSPPAASTPPMQNELTNLYRDFERATNADLEKSVGAAIGKAMDAALPNLKWAEKTGINSDGQARPLHERLAGAVREDIEAALKSDTALSEQVARVLSGRRFDKTSCAQVVRLIDTRAQQLIPGAVRRVVGSWTTATLGVKKSESVIEDKKPIAVERPPKDLARTERNDRVIAADGQPKFMRGRLDYRKYSDEQILEM